jgi:hypothetical protein
LLALTPFINFFIPADVKSENAYVITAVEGIKNLIFISIDMGILVFCWRVTTLKPEDRKTTETEEPIIEEEKDEIIKNNMAYVQLEEDEEALKIPNGDYQRQNLAEKIAKFLLSKYQNELADTQAYETPILGTPQEDIRVSTTSI